MADFDMGRFGYGPKWPVTWDCNAQIFRIGDWFQNIAVKYVSGLDGTFGSSVM